MSRPNRRGVSALEFALWMPMMLVMFAGVVDLSMYMNRTHTVVRAARESARRTSSTMLSQLSATSPSSLIDTELQDACVSHGLQVMSDSNRPCTGSCSVTCRWQTDATSATSGLATAPEVIIVTVQEPYTSVFNLLPFLSGTTAAATFTMVTMIQVTDLVP